MKTKFRTLIKKPKYQKKQGMFLFFFVIYLFGFSLFLIPLVGLESLFFIMILGEILLYAIPFKMLKIQEKETDEIILTFKNNGTEINLEEDLKMFYWCSFRFHNYIYGSRLTVNAIIECENGKRLHFTQSLPAWCDYPEGWEYCDAIFSEKEEVFIVKNLRKMVKVLEQKEQVTYANLL